MTDALAVARDLGASLSPALRSGWSGTAVLLGRLGLCIPFGDVVVSARTAPAREFGESRPGRADLIAVGWRVSGGHVEYTTGPGVAMFDSDAAALDLWLRVNTAGGWRAGRVVYRKRRDTGG